MSLLMFLDWNTMEIETWGKNHLFSEILDVLGPSVHRLMIQKTQEFKQKFSAIQSLEIANPFEWMTKPGQVSEERWQTLGGQAVPSRLAWERLFAESLALMWVQRDCVLIQPLCLCNYSVRAMKERKGAKEIKDRGGFQDPRGQRYVSYILICALRRWWLRLVLIEY